MSLLDGFSINSTNPPWDIQGAEKIKYDSIFDSLGPACGKLSGDVVSILSVVLFCNYYVSTNLFILSRFGQSC